MGKKLSQASLKISKIQKQQFSSLIKVLRPKVYITDSSSFKKLVQDLTGNNNGISTTTTSPSSSSSPSPTLEPIETSFEVSDLVSVSAATTTTTSSSSSEVCCYNQKCLDDTVKGGSNQTVDHWLEYQNLESLLLFDEPSLPLNNFYAQMEQDVSIYDYELWGLI